MSSTCATQNWVLIPGSKISNNPFHTSLEDLEEDTVEGMANQGGWILIGSKNRRTSLSPRQMHDDGQDGATGAAARPHAVGPTISRETLQRLLPQARGEVEGSAFYANLARAMALAEERCGEVSCSSIPWRWDNVEAVITYGLGSLHSGLNPRYQFSLAALLATRLSPLRSPAEFFDPVFTDDDTAAILEHGFRVVGRNEGGSRRVKRPTLFYLPHCEAELTEALLAANWGRDKLCNVAIIGNSFSEYVERWSMPGAGRGGLRRPDRMLALASLPGCCVEVRVADACFPVSSAFNDLSVHLFPEWHPALEELKEPPPLQK